MLIGGAASTEGNEIAGSRDGIVLQQVSNIRIRGNTIARSGSDGIYINSGSSGINILGNLIQPITVTGSTFANAGEGNWIDGANGANGVNVGDGSAQGRNIIGGNSHRAIRLGATTTNITIKGNYIGINATGNVAVANGQSAAANARDAIGVQFATVTNLTIRNNAAADPTGVDEGEWLLGAADIAHGRGAQTYPAR